MEIYADVVFFVNFIMDLFIFRITALLLRKKIKLWRLALGSLAAAGLYCLLIFIPQLNRYYNFYSSLLILIAGIALSFGASDIKEFAKALIYAHISAFAIGGVGIALFYYTNIAGALGNMVTFTIDHFSFKLLIASVCGSYVLIKLGIRLFNNTAMKKQAIFTLHISLGDNTAQIKALVDTGNTLCDPVSKDPVIIAEYEVIKNFLPDALKEVFENNMENDLSKLILSLAGTGLEKSFRMIPYKSLGNENGMLLGFKPDNILIEADNGRIMGDSCAVVGIYNKKFSADGRYHGLLGPEAVSKAEEKAA